jgi:lysozyme family protein
MRENRNTIIDLVFDSEKGYVNRPKTDNGGPTNMGITQKTLAAWRGKPVSIADVRNLTRTEAYEIYASEYWTPIRGDDLPSGLDYAVFDSCVTSGPNRAARILQMILVADGADLIVDGNIGVHTLEAVRSYSKGLIPLIRAYCEERVRWMKTLTGPKGFKANGRGWTIRVLGVDPTGQWKPQAGVLGTAIKMAQSKPIQKVTHLSAESVAPTIPDPVLPEATSKTADDAVSVSSILAKPEAIGTLITAGTGAVAAASNNTAISYAVAIAIVAGAMIAGYYFIKRIRTDHA